MDLIYVVILSIIEGITEFLPVSSTGHLILAARILNIPQTDFVKSFEIFIQLGAILAVFFLYGRKFLIDKKIMSSILTAFIPSAVVGLLFYKIIKGYLLGNSMVTVNSLLVGGVILILIEILLKHNKETINNVGKIGNFKALIIGFAQAISVVPGVSRAGATIVGGMLTGLDRKTAAEFSFLLAVPTILAASGLDLLKSNFYFNRSEIFTLIVGFILSFLSAVLGIKILTRATSKFSMTYFGVYRIILAIVFYVFFLR